MYHFCLAKLAAFVYGFPSRKLIVIGVTGTNGKTTTSYFLAKALEAEGYKTGCTTTAVFKIADKEWLNSIKMTMPGRFRLQKMLRDMVNAGCRYAIIETSSQGLIQHRHVGIEYDIAVFTNLTPEHIEAHGGFENYKKAKRILFEHIARLRPKIIQGETVPKAAVVNADSEFGLYYAQTPGLKQVAWFSMDAGQGLVASHLVLLPRSSRFHIAGREMELRVPGRFNVSNALAALATVQVLGRSVEEAVKQLSLIEHVPGRVEFVDLGQPWTVMVDYAPEPESLKQVYSAIDRIPHQRFIHVLGSCGGGRDVARRPILGRMAGERADIVIVTNEDPYDDDPKQIMEQVAEGVKEAGKVLNQDYFLIEDRAEAIRFAMKQAQTGDFVLMTGKGAETWICGPKGQKIPWNELETAKQALRELGYT